MPQVGAVGDGKTDADQDYRRMLQCNDLYVISISTVDRWHVKIAIEALEASKHVFCQNPLTLTLAENQLAHSAYLLFGALNVLKKRHRQANAGK